MNLQKTLDLCKIFQKFFYWYPFDWEIMGNSLFELSVGILPYPITFLVTDLISEIFGKKGIMTELFKKIGSLDQGERKEYASKLNSLKAKVEKILEKKLTDFEVFNVGGDQNNFTNLNNLQLQIYKTYTCLHIL